VQPVVQAPPAQTKGAHSSAPPGTQVPDPSQVLARWTVSPSEQVAAAHTASAGWSRHDPLPEHTPVVPQVETACTSHSSSGSLPSATGVHAPTVPARSHRLQAPTQEVSQHTESAQ
jgi:hypothetical protein